MAELERKYADRPVHFFHVTCGENPIQALDFRKHYRSEAAHLLDTDYRVSDAFRAGSWPTTVLVDPEGRIAGRWLGVTEEGKWVDALAKLDACLERADGGPPKGSYCLDGKCYVRRAGSAWENEPALAADGAGNLHLVYTREVGGCGDLFERTLTGDTWSEPARITTSAGDDYAPALCHDGERGLRLVWCSNRGPSGKYDIWTCRWDGSAWSPAEQVSKTDDDAARPRCVVDAQGNFWVTYYRWMAWGPRRSRDREVFVRYHDGRAWSAELQISPTDVPRYEDHADPAIAADGAGNVWVAWAWDTHPEEGKWAYDPTFGSAVFARQLRANQPMSQVQLVGMRAPSIAAAKRSAQWAFAPEVMCRSDVPWFAFAAHAPGGEHACAITRYEVGSGFPAPERLGINSSFVCTPRLISDPAGGLVAIWSAKLSANDTVQLARLDASGSWSPGRVVWSDPEASLWLPVGAFDAAGRLWLAAVRTAPSVCEVVVKRVDAP